MEKYGLGLTGPKPQTLEQLGVKLELATKKDWEDYKNIRIEAIDTDPIPLNVTDKEEAFAKKNRSEEEWKKDFEKWTIFLAKCGQRTIGMTKIVDEGSGMWSLGNVYLNPEFRKKITGAPIAEEMIKKALDEIKSKGGIRVQLWVKNDSHSALKLYKKFGFKKFNPIMSPKRALKLTGNRPDVLIGWQIMELDLVKKDN